MGSGDSAAPPTHVNAPLRQVSTTSLESKAKSLSAPTAKILVGDARKIDLADSSVDLIVTSPPYWRKRDYGHDDQIGQETTPAGYVTAGDGLS